MGLRGGSAARRLVVLSLSVLLGVSGMPPRALAEALEEVSPTGAEPADVVDVGLAGNAGGESLAIDVPEGDEGFVAVDPSAEVEGVGGEDVVADVTPDAGATGEHATEEDDLVEEAISEDDALEAPAAESASEGRADAVEAAEEDDLVEEAISVDDALEAPAAESASEGRADAVEAAEEDEQEDAGETGIATQSTGYDSSSTARSIAVNKQYTASLITDDDEDWYKFSTTSNGYVTLTFGRDYSTAGNGWTVYLYKADGTSSIMDWSFTADGDVRGSSDTTQKIGLPKGTYYVCVDVRRTGSWGQYSYATTVPYRLKVNFASSSVWDRETADDAMTSATPRSLNITYWGTTYCDSDEDWYKFSVPSRTSASLIFARDYSTAGNGWTVYLYKGDGTTEITRWDFLADADTNGTTTTTDPLTLEKGTYYVCVDVRRTGSWGQYSYATTVPYRLSLNTPNGIPRATIASVPKRTYTGSAIKPSPKVTIDSRTLKKGTDYTLSYANNVNVGTATITVKGKGRYSGSQQVTFQIVKANLSKASVSKISERTYTGSAIKPSPKVTLGGRTLTKGTDYTLSYANNTKVGTATITIKGKGNYTGTKKVTFQIVKAVPKVSYRTHVQTYGWQDWRSNGKASGTSGESKRLEAINIKLSGFPVSGGISYRTHVQTYGWQGWKSDGAMSGTSGESKRLEAIQVKLTGQMAQKYDVWYRVHAQTFGWMGWAKNGARAGTAGYSKRLEAIQILLKPKGSAAPSATYGGAEQMTEAAFRDANA